MNLKIATKSFYIFLLVSLISFQSCKQETPVESNRVVVGLTSDVSTLNPMFAFNLDEGSITELLFISLVQPEWNEAKSNLEIKPLFAKNWEWNRDSSSITFNLRDDVKWSDGQDCTAEDVVYSFDVYSDPQVQSRLYGEFGNFYVDKEKHIDLKKTFEILSPYILKINFLAKSKPNLFAIAIPIIPEHIYEKIPRKDFATAKQSFDPVCNGPFLLSSWKKDQALILKTNKNSFLYNPDNISELIFKIIPDYNSRLTQLKNGEIDLMDLIEPDDIKELKQAKNINIIPVKGREYDYIGWNNIDPDVYNKNNKVIPNKFFGNAKVRKALTYAINRKEIIEDYLNNYGELAVTPVTPIFKNSIDSSVKAYPYNVHKAKELLAEAGWKDSNHDGLLDKNGVKFSFTLDIPSGNPRREFASTVVKNNLKEIGIEMNVEQLEMKVFQRDIINKNVNSYMASWYVPIPIELKPFWYSDLESTPMNLVSYQNKNVDKLLEEMAKKISDKQLNKLYFKFQRIIHEDEPVTFLYWMDDIVGCNKRVKNTEINPLGVIQKCWNWSINK
ncbi:MAG: ABC transporter substrate-binding protein [Ignavibacteriaceae bacterium]